VRQLLAESVTLAVIAGVLGLLLAFAGIGAIRAVGGTLVRMREVSVDLRVLGWALAVSVFTGILVGLAPAITMGRGSLWASGADGGRGVAGGAVTRRIRRVLVVVECAVALALLVGAGLLVRSWWRVMHVDPGFRSEGVVSMNVSTPAFAENRRRATFYDLVLEQVRSLPGVESAGFSSELFVSSVSEQIVTAEGTIEPDPNACGSAETRSVEDSFNALGASLLRAVSFRSRMDPPLRGLRSSTRRWRGGCGLAAIQ
jgi:hypothetical protein